MKYLLLPLLAIMLSCNYPYHEVIAPLRGSDADCYCRLVAMAKHYYDCKLSNLRAAGFSDSLAHVRAVRETHLLLADTQLRLHLDLKARRRTCNCQQLSASWRYAKPPIER